MLDDLKYIHEKDRADALGLAEKEWQQLLAPLELHPSFQPAEIHNVVFAGMGGSALSALLARTWPKIRVPLEVVRDYDIPAYTGPQSLFIASSYSGNTEEELSAIAQAAERGAPIVVIASGGALADIAREKQYPLIVIPQASQPRYATLYSYRALITVLECAGLVDGTESDKALQDTADFLKQAVSAWGPTVKTDENPAKKLARELVGLSPVVYAGPALYPAAYKWKISFNENAKNVAWCNQYPEFNHNEFLGWSSHPPDKPYAVIDLRSSFDHPQIQKRFDVSARLLSGRRPAPHTVNAEGDTVLKQLMWTVAFGDFVSIYLALLNGIDPSPVDLIEKFKKEIA